MQLGRIETAHGRINPSDLTMDSILHSRFSDDKPPPILLPITSQRRSSMPHIVIQISGTETPDLTAQVVDAIGALTAEILGKRREVTSIQVHYAPHSQWFIGGESLAKQGKNAFHLDISVTDETNTKQEKARFIEQAADALSRLLGNVHEASFIHVIDARASAYGYGGRTQEYRYHRS
jgi:4-oxalocrotonate tautomerase